MKKHEYLPIFEEKLIDILNHSKRIKPLFKKLNAAFKQIQLIIPLAKAVTIKLVETESLRYSVFYQSGNNLSKHAIVILHNNYENYLWFDGGELYFNDDNLYSDDIAKCLASIPTLVSYPETVKDLYWLIKSDLWNFSLHRFPKFNDKPPEDIDEVLSWDETHLMIGNSINNIEIVTREYWDKLCFKEKNWFKK